MKTFLLFLVVLSCSTCVFCGSPPDIQAVLLNFPKNWEDFGEICDLVGVEVSPSDREVLQKVWSGLIHLAKDRVHEYFSNNN